MTTMKLLREPHSFKHGDRVSIYKRNKPEIKYPGTIYGIYNQPLQNGVKNSPYIDYIYVSIDNVAAYSKLLMRGWSIIYKGEQRVIGDIEKNDQGQIIRLFIQSKFFAIVEEAIIQLSDIDAILVWRVAFGISKVAFGILSE